jgi:uncharacterized protein
MPSHERVQALIDRVQQGHFVQAMQDFYAADASMQENLLPPRRGIETLVAHEKGMLAAFAAVRAMPVQEFWMAGDQVVIPWVFVFTSRDGTEIRLDELTLQRWQGDRIVEERFYYDPSQLQPIRSADAQPATTSKIATSRSDRHNAGPGIYSVVKRYADAWAANDLAGMFACYHDDVTFHYFGHSPLAGTHRGKAACLGILKLVQEKTGRRLLSIRDVLAGEHFGVIVALERFDGGDAPQDMERLFRYRVMEDQLVECWVYDADQLRVDAYWA